MSTKKSTDRVTGDPPLTEKVRVAGELARSIKTQDVTSVLSERGARYGKFSEHARITQNTKRAMEDSPNWSKLSPAQRESLEMIAHKIGRILNGDPNYADSWIDIAGYAKLVADLCEGVDN